jgi:membrane-associated phospholipid phosphatase
VPNGQLSRKVGLLALALICAGILLHFSRFNTLWMTLVHGLPVIHEGFWLFITNLGRGWPTFAILAALDLGSGRRTALFFRCILISAVLLPLMKKFFSVARPVAVMEPGVLHLMGVPVSGMSSMPSGHALTAGAVLAVLWFAHTNHEPNRRFPYAGLAAVLIALLVAFSRIMIGAHWPADVLVGLGIGMLMAYAAYWHEQRQPWANALSKGYWPWAIIALQFISAGILFWSAAENPLEVMPNLLLGIGALLLAIFSLRHHYQQSVLMRGSEICSD